MDRQFRTRFFRRQFQTRPSRNVGAFQEILAAEDDTDKTFPSTSLTVPESKLERFKSMPVQQ